MPAAEGSDDRSPKAPARKGRGRRSGAGTTAADEARQRKWRSDAADEGSAPWPRRDHRWEAEV